MGNEKGCVNLRLTNVCILQAGHARKLVNPSHQALGAASSTSTGRYRGERKREHAPALDLFLGAFGGATFA